MRLKREVRGLTRIVSVSVSVLLVIVLVFLEVKQNICTPAKKQDARISIFFEYSSEV